MKVFWPPVASGTGAFDMASTSSLLPNESSAVSAKAKIADLLHSLPTAQALQAESAASPAAEERRQYIGRFRALRDSYAEYLCSRFLELLEEARKKGHGWVTIERAYVPSVINVEKNEVFWTGADGAETLKVKLLQGPMNKGRPDPTQLPDGLTSVDKIRERLAKKEYGVQTTYNKGMVSVIVIWDHATWKRTQDLYRAQRAQRRDQYRERDHRDQREYSDEGPAEPVQLTIDEYRAQQAAKATLKKPTEGEWQKVKTHKTPH